MALFPSLSELFSSKAPPAPLTPAQQQTLALANRQGGPENNTTVPSATTLKSDGSVPAIPEAAKGEASPLDGYKDIWQTPATLSHASKLAPEIVVNPEDMLKAAQGFDFTKQMDPELLTKASSGDAAALASVINRAVQAGYAQAATASVAITKNALAQQATKFETDYAPHMLRTASIADEVSKSVSLANDPAAAPIVAALRAQLSAKFPSASPAEIAAHTNTYLSEFAQKAVESSGGRIQTSDQLKAVQSPFAKKEQDWDSFFST